MKSPHDPETRHRGNFLRVRMRAVLKVPGAHTRDDAVGSGEPRREVDVLAVHPGEPHPEDGVQPVVHRPWGGGGPVGMPVDGKHTAYESVEQCS